MLFRSPKASAPKSTQEEVATEPSPSKEAVAQSEGAASSVPVLEALDALPVLDEEHAQEIPAHVDTWIEVLQKRTERLTDEIRELNARLDVLEKNQRVNHGGS